MKRIASILGAGTLLLGMAIPTFAYVRHHRSSDDTRVSNYARVTNDVEVKADTGDNEIEGFMVHRARISSGAASANSTVLTDANYNEIACNDCNGDLSIRNSARVRNEVEVRADSGDNEVEGWLSGGRISTGPAAAGSLVDNIVNTNIIGD